MSADVLVRLRQELPTLRPAEARIAQAVLDDPPGVVSSTITELAARASTSQATVVRFCRAVGYAGYPEFRIDLAQATSRRELELERSGITEGEIEDGDSAAAVVSKIAFHEARTIEETARLLDVEALEKVAEAVSSADRVDVFGVGSSGLASQDLAQRLMRAGLLATAPVDPHQQLTQAALLGPGTVAVAISHTGTTVEPYQALSLARERGALAVAITNFPSSPLAAAADVVLTTTARETRFRPGAMSGRIAQLALVDLLFVRVVQRRHDCAAAALRATTEAVSPRRLDPKA
ncbi:RpiR family transcriptional regulator [Xylanimonas oleitrophica]|uniref:RpiR family transcriptional regulator n=1 Tax=Xylanimonas oleitrophica TaxID=2607479 RepID=A0A2W5Y224_9MICO|nr:MurR/RpiR family transcriptional regulator [Xylanimonas oleitrophica]PZR51554.1 RpiR family transcriptional regulator [Xylanimonas oleitrophica]